jgi:hypothetical protein
LSAFTTIFLPLLQAFCGMADSKQQRWTVRSASVDVFLASSHGAGVTPYVVVPRGTT